MTLERCVIAAGVVVSVAAWWRRVEPLPEEPDDVPFDDAARRAGDFELELTRARRAPRSRRLMTSLAFASLFFAGAAFTAGAGNELVASHTDEPAATAAATDAVPAAAPEAEPAAEPAAAVAPEGTASAPEPAATEAPAAAPAPEPTAAAAPDAPPSDDVTPATAPTRAGYVAPAPSTVEAPVQSKPAAASIARPVRKQAVTRRTESRPSPLLPAAASFVPAVPFDLEAWEHENPASSTGATAVAIAKHFIGTPYVWGGASPSGGFDCSGLMQFVYGQLGIALPHYAATQFAIFPRLSPSALRPGDLVFFEPKVDGPGHVAMYLGGDAIVEAPHTGALVRIGSLARSAAALGFLGAVRPYGDAASRSRLIAAHVSSSGIGPAESALSV